MSRQNASLPGSLGLLVALAFAPVQSAAQEAEPSPPPASSADAEPPGDGSAPQIEEIFVTVQKRGQSTQEVPLSVSAYDESFMDQMNVQDFRGLVDLTPGFNGKTEDGFIDALAIRGISTNDFGIGGDPSVAVFVNGMFEGRNGGAVTTFLDVQRAEVVRGPQNTLFGRNAIAGAVSVFTNPPEQELGGRFNFGIEEYDHYDVEATLNVPLAEQLSFRGTAYYLTEDGYLRNVVGGSRLGVHEDFAFQGALRFDNDKVDATLSAFYEERDGAPSVYFNTAELDSSGRPVPVGSGSRLDDDEVATDLGSSGRDESQVFRLTLNADVELSGGYSLHSLTGYKTYDFFYLEDYDATSEASDNYKQDQSVDYVSQELRLNSPGEGRFYWFVGASFYFEDVDADFEAVYDEDALCRALAISEAPDFTAPTVSGCLDPVFQAYYGGLFTGTPLVGKRERNDDRGENWGWAIYADATFDVSERLHVTAGGRFTWDEKEMRIRVHNSQGALGNNFAFEFYTDENGDGVADFTEEDHSWKAFTPRLAIDYAPNDQLTLYANVARGYKAGGFATFGLDSSGAVPQSDADGYTFLSGARPERFDQEESTAFELGGKTLLLDKTLQTNAAFYLYDYDDLQLTFFDAGSTRTQNVAEAFGYGFELDLRWAPVERFDLFFSLAWSQTEIEKVDSSFIAAGGCSSCQGNDLPMAPEWDVTTVATYRIPLGTKGELFVSGTHHYQGAMFGGVDNLELSETDAWNQVDLQLGFDSTQAWSLVLYLNNVFDEEYFERGWENADASNQFGYGIVNTLVWPSKPRTFGARLRYEF
jgi:iron complex outermembrane receptor protein